MNRTNKAFRIRKSAAGKVGKWYLTGFVGYQRNPADGRFFARYDTIIIGAGSPGDILDVLHNPPPSFVEVIDRHVKLWRGSPWPWGS